MSRDAYNYPSKQKTLKGKIQCLSLEIKLLTWKLRDLKPLSDSDKISKKHDKP